MKLARIAACFLVVGLFLAGIRELFHFFALNDSAIKYDKIGKYRLLTLYMRAKTLNNLMNEYFQNQKSLRNQRKEVFQKILLKRSSEKPRLSGKKVCQMKVGRIKKFFRVKDRVYLLAWPKDYTKNYYQIYDADRCRLLKRTFFFYISSSYTGELTALGRFNRLAWLNHTLVITRKKELEDRLIKDVYSIKGKLYLHIERLHPGIAAVEILFGEKSRGIFFLSRNWGDDVEAHHILNDTVFYPGKHLYITFTYPFLEEVNLYTYSPEGKPLKELTFKFSQNYQLPPEWANSEKVLSARTNRIAAVTAIFEGKEKVYVFMQKGSIDRGRIFSKQEFLYLIDRKRNEFYELKLPYGLTMFYSGEYFYSVKLPEGNIYRWKLEENKR